MISSTLSPISPALSSSSSAAPPVAAKGPDVAGKVTGGSGPVGHKPGGKPKRKGENGEIYVDGDGKRWKCSIYMRGTSEVNTWYQIDESGARILGTSFKPPGVGTKVWAKMTEVQKLEAIAKHSSSGGVVSTKPRPEIG